MNNNNLKWSCPACGHAFIFNPLRITTSKFNIGDDVWYKNCNGEFTSLRIAKIEDDKVYSHFGSFLYLDKVFKTKNELIQTEIDRLNKMMKE